MSDHSTLRVEQMQGSAMTARWVGTLTHFATPDITHLQALPHIGLLFPALQRAFDDRHMQLDAFAQAWMLMYVAIRRLDALQDGDALAFTHPFDATPAASYHLVFALYVRAQQLLNALPEPIPAARHLRLYGFWHETMLRMAEGQYADLHVLATGEPLDLDRYQQIVQAKTGATFALAFGGAALLLQDDPAVVDALTVCGELYGTLIQYADDMRDWQAQPDHAPTLATALRDHPTFRDAPDPQQALRAFWQHCYPQYRRAVDVALAETPAAVQQAICTLFQQVFESPSEA